MQKMTILGLPKRIRWIAEKMYNTLPNTKAYEIGDKLIVETVLTYEDKRKITEEYNKTGNTVLFENI